MYYFEQKCHFILINNILIYICQLFLYTFYILIQQLKYLFFFKVEIFFLIASFTTDQIVVK